MVTLNRNEVVTLNWKQVVNITEFYSKESLLSALGKSFIQAGHKFIFCIGKEYPRY